MSPAYPELNQCGIDANITVDVENWQPFVGDF
jgi:hypothetical protein